jgi:hypothetical protein
VIRRHLARIRKVDGEEYLPDLEGCGNSNSLLHNTKRLLRPIQAIYLTMASRHHITFIWHPDNQLFNPNRNAPVAKTPFIVVLSSAGVAAPVRISAG